MVYCILSGACALFCHLWLYFAANGFYTLDIAKCYTRHLNAVCFQSTCYEYGEHGQQVIFNKSYKT